MLALIAMSLLPIVLGAVAENENLRREQYRAMREEHRRRIAIERRRLAERRAAIRLGVRAANGLSNISTSAADTVQR